MKRLVAAMLVSLFLVGCGSHHEELERVMGLRAALLGSGGCTFDAKITADYGEVSFAFSMACQADGQGNMTFTVKEPESIAGITGSVSAQGGKLTFDDTALAFDLLAEGQVTPVTAPWLLVKTLRGGYVTSCGMEEEKLRVSIDDSYEEDALRLDIWLDDKDMPIYGEILWAERRILSMEIINFQIV